DVVPHPGSARLPGQPRRLPSSARPVRADMPAPRPRRGCPQPGPHRARAVPDRPAAASWPELCRLRGAHRRPARAHPGVGRASERDIAAITVNRWSHGYGYVANSLFDPDDYDDKVLAQARQTVGRVAIANSDAAGDAYAHLAIDQAARAVRELLG